MMMVSLPLQALIKPKDPKTMVKARNNTPIRMAGDIRLV